VSITRRSLLQSLFFVLAARRAGAATVVSTLVGTGAGGFSDQQVNNPYGVIFGPDGALYFCDLDNQRIRRLDILTRRMTTVAGSGQKGYGGDGGPATAASLNMPHEIQFDARGHLYIAERDNHVIRKVDGATGVISTLAGTNVAGFSGDGGPAARAQLRQPHSIVIDRQGQLLICDIGNQRIRKVDLASGTIDTYAGTGVAQPPSDGARVAGTPLNGPRTMVVDERGDLFLALREGNAIYRIATGTQTLHHVAGTGKQGFSGDGGPARAAELAGPKGLAYGGGSLFVADTENHVIRKIDISSGLITTILGTGERGDGPETDPLKCRLSRPHGLTVDSSGVLYVTDSEAHRIRLLKST
jgi:DNA-binding beta-propeller fold protein YncE